MALILLLNLLTLTYVYKYVVFGEALGLFISSFTLESISINCNVMNQYYKWKNPFSWYLCRLYMREFINQLMQSSTLYELVLRLVLLLVPLADV